MVLEEDIPDIFRHSGCSLDVILTFLVGQGVDTIIERVPIIPNWPESARGELEWQRVGVNSNHALKQLCPTFVLIFITENIAILF